MSADTTITMQGPFTLDDIQELARTFRRCEQRNPTAEYKLLINSDVPTSAREMLEKVFPRLPNGLIDWREIDRRTINLEEGQP